MAITFPDQPWVDGQTFTVGFKKYTYDEGSEAWVASAYTRADLEDTASDNVLTAIQSGAPEALDTLDELAAALDDNADILDLVADRYQTVDATKITANYTLVIADMNTIKVASNTDAIELHIPDNAGLIVGTVVKIAKIGAGDITVIGDGTVALDVATNSSTISGKTTITLTKSASATWLVEAQQQASSNTAAFDFGSDSMTGTATVATSFPATQDSTFITANTYITVTPTGEPAGTWTVQSYDGYFTITSDADENAIGFDWNGVKKVG